MFHRLSSAAEHTAYARVIKLDSVANVRVQSYQAALAAGVKMGVDSDIIDEGSTLRITFSCPVANGLHEHFRAFRGVSSRFRDPNAPRTPADEVTPASPSCKRSRQTPRE